jgi:hypothetical protein
MTRSCKSHLANVGVVPMAGLITLVPGDPSFWALSAPTSGPVCSLAAALIILHLLSNDREVTGSSASGLVTNPVENTVIGWRKSLSSGDRARTVY